MKEDFNNVTMTLDKYGSQIWRDKEGKRHRMGAPAEISKDGKIKRWFQNDTLHRDDGPAIEGVNNEYFVHGVAMGKKAYERWQVKNGKANAPKPGN